GVHDAEAKACRATTATPRSVSPGSRRLSKASSRSANRWPVRRDFLRMTHLAGKGKASGRNSVALAQPVPERGVRKGWRWTTSGPYPIRVKRAPSANLRFGLLFSTEHRD